MIREIRKEDRQLYMEMSEEFYNSEAVLHSIPESYREAAWEERCVPKNSKGIYSGKRWRTGGVRLTSYTFSQEAGGKVVWLEELYIRPQFRCQGLGKEFFTYVDEKIAPTVKRIRLEIEPDNLRAKKLYLAMGYEDLAYAQMVKEVQEGK